jgi:cyclopropane fatty-acyl-phospholipid synthase-like methyltransferase
VLEVGSLNINGTVRVFFENCDYVGVDLSEGKDVDIIGRVHNLPLEKDFDTVISCECFEHDKYWQQTFNAMYEMSKELVIFSCATTGRPEHGTTATSPKDSPFTNDYYKNLTEQDFRSFFNFEEMFKEFEFKINKNPADLYFWGIK